MESEIFKKGIAKRRKVLGDAYVDKALASDKIVDIFEAAGLESPDISILSDSFLDEVKNMKQKNLAVEMLARLLKGEVKSKTVTNIIQAKKYSELLANALLKYRLYNVFGAVFVHYVGSIMFLKWTLHLCNGHFAAIHIQQFFSVRNLWSYLCH